MKAGSRNAAPLLRAITLPVNQVLDTAAPWSNTQQAFYSECQMAIDDTGRMGEPGDRKQRAVRHRLNPRYMGSRVNTEGTGITRDGQQWD